MKWLEFLFQKPKNFDVEFKEQKKKYVEPFRCRTFGHDFQETVYTAYTCPIFTSNLEVCTKCGGGKVMDLFGYKYFTPESVNKFLTEEKALKEKDTNVLKLEKAKT